jgi:hypothetical protein
MTFLDAAILNLTEWFCRRFQLLTGRTNVWLAVHLTNLSIIVYFVWAGVYFWSSDVVARMALGLFCAGLLYVLTQTVFKVPIEVYENDAYRRVAKGLRNPRRVRDAGLRISFLTLSLVLFYPVFLVYMNLHVPMAPLTYSLIVLTTVVLYLLACDPLPPCAGKVREWLRSAQSPLKATSFVILASMVLNRIILLSVIAAACITSGCRSTTSSSSIPGSGPTTPTGPIADLAGTWIGTLESANVSTMTISLNVVQSGNCVDGAWISSSGDWKGAISGVATADAFGGYISFERPDNGAGACNATGSVSGPASQGTFTMTVSGLTPVGGCTGDLPARILMTLHRQ